MRILQISSAENFGGGERHLIDLIEGLRQRNHDVFAVLRAKGDWQKRLTLLPKGNKIFLPLRNSLDVFSARRIAKFVREKQIKIIHAHLARDYPVAAMATRLAPEAKLVLTRHLLLPLKSFHKLTALQVSAVIAVSGAVRDCLLAQKIFPREKIRLVLNGTDVENLARNTRRTDKRNLQKQLQIPADSFLVGTIGELKNIKGQDLFLQAAAQILEKFPNAHFVVAGADNSRRKEYENRLRTLVAQLKLNERVHFTGLVEDVGALMRGLDVFVSPARTEPFGLVLIEALACRTPVVAAATEGAREILRDGETGKLVPIENYVKIAEAACAFLSSESLRETFGESAQTEAKEKFDLGKMVAETENIYQEILTADAHR